MTEQNPPASQTILIVIGNSDDRLKQAEWAQYINDVDDWIDWAEEAPGVQVHGRWHSYPNTRWQNASWLLVVSAEAEYAVRRLREELPVLCDKYGQDSIAFVVGDTEFIGPAGE